MVLPLQIRINITIKFSIFKLVYATTLIAPVAYFPYKAQ